MSKQIPDFVLVALTEHVSILEHKKISFSYYVPKIAFKLN